MTEETSQGETHTDTSELEAEIAAGIDAVVKEQQGKAEDDDAVDAPAQAADEDETEVEEPADSVAPPSLPESLLERAVRAGIPLSEAKQYPNESLLENMVSRVEGKKDVGSQSDADTASDGEVDPASAFDEIPDLDPDDYDEKIVAGFRAMKEIIKQQFQKIESMREGRSKDFFASQLDRVKDFTQGDPEKIGAVREKFEVLSAGYEAAGKEIARESIFDEAAQLVLGADMVSAQQKDKASAAARRSGQRISRPSGNRVKPVVDPFDEVAALLDRKYAKG